MLLIVLSLAPARGLGWLDWFHRLMRTVVAPVAHPLTLVSDVVAPPESTGATDERIAQLEAELDRARLALRQARVTIDDLVSINQQLSQGQRHNPDAPVVQLPRPRIGNSGELLSIRAGTNDGVLVGTVVTTAGVQLVGRVEDVGPLECLVSPITARRAPKIQGVVLQNQDGTRTRACLLSPTGDGKLRGDVEGPDENLRAEDVIPIAIGMTVCLLDEEWPRNAQMLVIGTIERIEPADDDPLRRVITVEPTTDLQRVSEVVLRIPVDQGPGGDG